MDGTSSYKRLSKDEAVALFVDHQAGLISMVQDYPPGEFKNNVLALANIAKFFKLPTILTTSFEQGPNGPIVPELKETFPEAPFIPRPGQINAWDNEDFVKAVKATGRRQLLIAGVVTDVCVASPRSRHWQKAMTCSWSPMRPAPSIQRSARRRGCAWRRPGPSW
jgi:nicotinamidase-related amidase